MAIQAPPPPLALLLELRKERQRRLAERAQARQGYTDEDDMDSWAALARCSRDLGRRRRRAWAQVRDCALAELREARRAHEAASLETQQQKVAEVEARLREDEKNRAAEASERFAAELKLALDDLELRKDRDARAALDKAASEAEATRKAPSTRFSTRSPSGAGTSWPRGYHCTTCTATTTGRGSTTQRDASLTSCPAPTCAWG